MDKGDRVLMPKLKMYDVVRLRRKIGVVMRTDGDGPQVGQMTVAFRRETDGQLDAPCIFRWGPQRAPLVARLGTVAVCTTIVWPDGVETSLQAFPTAARRP